MYWIPSPVPHWIYITYDMHTIHILTHHLGIPLTSRSTHNNYHWPNTSGMQRSAAILLWAPARGDLKNISFQVHQHQHPYIPSTIILWFCTIIGSESIHKNHFPQDLLLLGFPTQKQNPFREKSTCTLLWFLNIHVQVIHFIFNALCYYFSSMILNNSSL